MKKTISALCIGFFLCYLLSAYMDSTKTALAEGVIRLHVIANSDSEQDQALKLKVRDEILVQCGAFFSENKKIDTVRSDIVTNLDYIEQIAKKEIEKNGFDYDVDVSFGMSEFPRKEYGSVTLPAGEYQALRVKIGEASGKNWWCVMFPPLCFVDETCVSISDESNLALKSQLGTKTYDMVTSTGASTRFRMKTYELWQEGKSRLSSYLATIGEAS